MEVDVVNQVSNRKLEHKDTDLGGLLVLLGQCFLHVEGGYCGHALKGRTQQTGGLVATVKTLQNDVEIVSRGGGREDIGLDPRMAGE